MRRAAPAVPAPWTPYVDPRRRADAYSIAGPTMLFQAADPALRRLIRQHWTHFQIPSSRMNRLDVVFRFPKPTANRPLHVKTDITFITDRFVCLSDGKRYLVTGYFRRRPWQIDCLPLAQWDPAFVYYYVVEPLILDLLKRQNILVWHGAAVERGGRAVLLSGVSGSGKSTTTLNLLTLGHRFLADDVVLLRPGKHGVDVLGWEQALFVTARTLALLPEWRRLHSGGRHKRGRQWKHRIDMRRFRSQTGRARVAAILFPHVDGRASTAITPLTKAQALVACLQQPPKEFPASVFPSAVERQFDVYDRLVRTATSYELRLGADQTRVRAALGLLGGAR